MSKNRHAVALGRLGGKGGKGSDKRKLAAIKANRIRWIKYAQAKYVALSKQSQCQSTENVENKV